MDGRVVLLLCSVLTVTQTNETTTYPSVETTGETIDKPRSVVVPADSSIKPIEGTRYSLRCSSDTPGVTKWWWRRGDEVIQYGESDTQNLDLQHPKDTATYTCAAENAAGKGDRSPGYELKVLYSPRGTSSLTIDMNPATVGEEVTMTCELSGDRGFPEPSYKYYNGSNLLKNIKGAYKKTFSSVKESAQLTCSAINDVGEGPNSDTQQLTVLGTAFIESPISNENASLIYSQDDLILNCTASGHQRSLSWTKDSETLPSDLFDKKEYTLTLGPYKYDQAEALKSTLTWRKPAATCEEINKYNGQYTCEVVVNIGGRPSKADVSYNVNVRYAPIFKQGNFSKVSRSLGETIELKCDTCSNPPQRTYTWSRVEGDLGSNIYGTDTETLTISNVQQDDFDTYKCRVCNDIDCEELHMELLPKIIITEKGDNPNLVYLAILAVLAVLAVLVIVVIKWHEIIKRKDKKHQSDYEYTPVSKVEKTPAHVTSEDVRLNDASIKANSNDANNHESIRKSNPAECTNLKGKSRETYKNGELNTLAVEDEELPSKTSKSNSKLDNDLPMCSCDSDQKIDGPIKSDIGIEGNIKVNEPQTVVNIAEEEVAGISTKANVEERAGGDMVHSAEEAPIIVIENVAPATTEMEHVTVCFHIPPAFSKPADQDSEAKVLYKFIDFVKEKCKNKSLLLRIEDKKCVHRTSKSEPSNDKYKMFKVKVNKGVIKSPLVLPCVNASRVGSDVDATFNKAKIPGGLRPILLLLHPRAEFRTDIDPPTRIKADVTERCEDIIDVVFSNRDPSLLYDCRQNIKAGKEFIQKFLDTDC